VDRTDLDAAGPLQLVVGVDARLLKDALEDDIVFR
jgi:hypothetical protein